MPGFTRAMLEPRFIGVFLELKSAGADLKARSIGTTLAH
jgi:hypothetical protein